MTNLYTAGAPARAPDTVPGPSGRHLPIVATAAAAALALVFFMVSSVTGAAWTDTTSNAGNSWATGTVSLTDNDAEAAMFTATGMVPGSVVTNSITVTNESTVPLDIRLYGANYADLSLLGANLNVLIGTTSGAGDVYTGTLTGFNTAHTSYATGTPVISLAAAGTQTYFFSVELDAGTLDTFQGTSSSIDFVWEGHTQ